MNCEIFTKAMNRWLVALAITPSAIYYWSKNSSGNIPSKILSNLYDCGVLTRTGQGKVLIKTVCLS